MKKSQKLEAAQYLTFDSFTTHQLFNKYLQKQMPVWQTQQKLHQTSR
jgi:hypothetical protein